MCAWRRRWSARATEPRPAHPIALDDDALETRRLVLVAVNNRQWDFSCFSVSKSLSPSSLDTPPQRGEVPCARRAARTEPPRTDTASLSSRVSRTRSPDDASRPGISPRAPTTWAPLGRFERPTAARWVPPTLATDEPRRPSRGLACRGLRLRRVRRLRDRHRASGGRVGPPERTRRRRRGWTKATMRKLKRRRL